MPCEDYYYVKDLQDTKKQLTEVEAMEAYANENSTKIHWFQDFAYFEFITGNENEETGEPENIGIMTKEATLENLKKFINECKQEIANDV